MSAKQKNITNIPARKRRGSKKSSTATSKVSTREIISDVKTVSAVAYLGIFFFIPLLTNPRSKFARFHANQGLSLLIFAVLVNVIGGVVPIIGWFIILPIGTLIMIVYFILGITNALSGRMKRLPLIGEYELLDSLFRSRVNQV